MKIHPVFHANLLRLDSNDAIKGQQQEPEPPVIVNGEEEWEVDEILDSKVIRKKLFYKAAWKNYPPDETCDPDRRHTAQTEYRKLYQRNNTFAVFWAEFQRLMTELDYSEETLLDDLRFKVNQQMQKALVAEVGATTLHEFAKKCMLIDQNI
ncbi:hypothetical protein GMDG_04372 [Pseudogymnoascus destructans 20631-21]|uniref:Retrotransposon gag domain-containing protein n=1 Tax=Pseudogymnoascus destructans (strain ATCC MYA-4855 / 20631-21) TaxID=658429 RepID=L8GAG8_PSED2|nr:hypothetical protein GMDG_04372 [Pseudogymnoascus destructans 20631-21]